MADSVRPGVPVELAPGQPVVGLDFDGVLNIVVGEDIPEGYQAHVVPLDRATWPTHPYIRPLPVGDFNVLHRVVVSLIHGPMIRAWQAAGAEVVWATTWERAVLPNAVLSDVPDLPVLEISKVVAEPRPHRTADWKVQGLQTAFAGHPIVWVDDFGTDLAGESTYGDPPAPMLVVAPDETIGLTQADSDRIVDFLERNR